MSRKLAKCGMRNAECGIDAKITLRTAARLLDLEARCLKRSHTIKGRWVIADKADQQAYESFVSMRRVSKSLRAIAESGLIPNSAFRIPHSKS